MNSAAFLLVINFSIGVSFAAAFLALTRRSRVRLGRWCAVGFLSAAATVTIEGSASLIPSVRVVSAVSFCLLMTALTTITAGLSRHYRPDARITWLAALFVGAAALNMLVVFDLPRGSWGQALGYQGPYVLVLGIAAGIVVVTSPRRPIDWILAAVLGLSGIQFLTKAILAGMAGRGPGVRDYLVSTYAFYSQTAGGILSLLLGLALVGLVVRAVMDEAKDRLQRDALSGLLNRAAFMERVPAALRRTGRKAPATLILLDLDRFKAINDRFGHAAGDEVIRGVGDSLRARFGETALCGRLGGEEFCVLVPDCPSAAARVHLEALQARLRANRYRSIPDHIPVTASYGVALMNDDEPFEEALRRADMALYAVKAAGRDAYRFAPMRAVERGSAGTPFRSGSKRPTDGAGLPLQASHQAGDAVHPGLDAGGLGPDTA